MYSTTNQPLAPAGTLKVTLGVQPASLHDGILQILTPVASDSTGATSSANPGAIPVIMTVTPSSLAKAAVGRNVPVSVEVVDLDGSVSSVAFQLNGSTVATDSSLPFGASLTSSTAGDFALTVLAQDNQGRSIQSSPASLQFINPASLTTFASFQAAWLGGAGAFDAAVSGSGIPNGLAWALGIDPYAPDRPRLPTCALETIGQGRFLVYRARVLASGVVYQILGSTTLALDGWSAVPPAQITKTLEAGGWRRVEARIPMTGSTPSKFVTLQVQQP